MKNVAEKGVQKALRGKALKAEVPRIGSGFRLRAPAPLTPAKRLNLTRADLEQYPQVSARIEGWFCVRGGRAGISPVDPYV